MQVARFLVEAVVSRAKASAASRGQRPRYCGGNHGSIVAPCRFSAGALR